MNTSNQLSGTELATGQLWKTPNSYVQIVDHGNRVIHYKILEKPAQSAVTRLIRKDALADYLKSTQATLLN